MSNKKWKGNRKELGDKLVPIDSLEPSEGNARKHTNKDVTVNALSLADHGQQKPIVTKDGKIVAGEGTWLAARSLGWDEIAAIESDLEDPSELKLYAIRDNRVAELSAWNTDNLADSLVELSESHDLEATKLWEQSELEPLLKRAERDVSTTGGGSRSGPRDERDSADGEVSFGRPILVTDDQREVFERARVKAAEQIAQEESKDVETVLQTLSEGRALELICGDFLA